MHGRTLGGFTVLLCLALAAPAGASTCAQAASDVATPGNVVTIDAGLTCPQSFNLAANVTLQGADGSVVLAPASGRAITGTDVQNAVVRSLRIQGDGASANTGGITFTGNSAPTIQDVRITLSKSSSAGGGISIFSSAASGTITLQTVTVGIPPQVNTAATDGGGVRIKGTGDAGVLIDHGDFEGNTAGAHGGNMYLELPATAKVVVRDSFIAGGKAGPSTSAAGGGAYIQAGDVTFLRNTVRQNTLKGVDGTPSNAGGAGVSILARTFDVAHNVVTQNAIAPLADGTQRLFVIGIGGALTGGGTMIDNRWTDNSDGGPHADPTAGSGVYVAPYCDGSNQPLSVTAAGELVSGNASHGLTWGAVSVASTCSGSLTLADSTVTGNTGVGGDPSQGPAGGVFALYSAVVLIRNSIVWNNQVTPELFAASGASLDVGFSDVCNGSSAWAGTGNVCVDPLVTPSSGEIAASSPLVDAGSNDLVPASLLAEIPAATRIKDGNGDCTATVDIGFWETATKACSSSPSPQPDPTPTPTPPLTDPGQVLLCAGSKVTLIDVRRAGRKIVIRGVALTTLAGRKVRITARPGNGRFTARVAKDGSFALRVRAPKGAVSYTADYGGSKSSPLKTTRNLTVISQRRVAGGIRVVAEHSKGRGVAGQKATLRRQTGCDKQVAGGTARFDRHGRVSFLLPAPSPPDTVAVYRITTRTNRTYTLPIVVRR